MSGPSLSERTALEGVQEVWPCSACRYVLLLLATVHLDTPSLLWTSFVGAYAVAISTGRAADLPSLLVIA